MTGREGGTLVGHVAEIHRYPVKSMQGETLDRVFVGPEGLDGDRRFGVIDAETGRVASAKNPRKWAALLALRAELRDDVFSITTPNGSAFRRGYDDLDAAVSRFLGRAVTLNGASPSPTAIEISWPDVPGLANAGTESVEGLRTGGYFDVAPIHLLTTATLRRFRDLAPDSDFDARRFRPNVVIETRPELTGFVEREWVGREVVIGEARLRVTAPCTRCVMTTLAQPDLGADTRVLRTAVAHNAAAVGVYANTESYGSLVVGAAVWLA